ncbi:hypothetical protein [Nonomuraea sp. NPDC049625]|uniref:hypothetical protein n=1 Tax=Nonomuraea sp. NPDC049625 TaxID=3155775 RepID=UPI00343C7C43
MTGSVVKDAPLPAPTHPPPRTTRPGAVPVSARSPYDVQRLQRELSVRRLAPSWPS